MVATADKREERDDLATFCGLGINRFHSEETKDYTLLHVANLYSEEPDAVVPHVRVCGDASRCCCNGLHYPAIRNKLSLC